MLQSVLPTNPFATHIRDMKHIKANARKKKVKKDEIPAETAEEPVKETAVVEAEAEESKDTEKEEA